MKRGELARLNYDFLAARASLLPPFEALAAEAPHLRLQRARNGEPTVAVVTPRGTISLHSGYNPGVEGERLARDFELGEADLVLVLGCGLGYHIERLLDRLAPGTCVIVIERDPAVFAQFIDRLDWATRLRPFDCCFAVARDVELLGDHLSRVPFLTRPLRVVTFSHGPSVGLAPELYAATERAVLQFLRDNPRNIRTLLANAPLFFENVVANVEVFARQPGVAELFGRFGGRPIILVAAGPSLDGNGGALREVGDRALIIVVDTALKPLLALGVEPHLVVASDPLPENVMHLAGLPPQHAILIGEPSLQPAIFQAYSGDTRLYLLDEAPQRFFAEYLGDKGNLKAWGSVSTCALDLAIKLDGNPIVFVGQDLAYTGNRLYCRNTAREEELERRREFLESWVRGPSTIEVPDVFGEPIRTTAALRGYAAHMRGQMFACRGRRFINATEGGIVGEPAEIMPLSRALQECLGPPFDPALLQSRAPLKEWHASHLEPAIKRLRASQLFLARALADIPHVVGRPLAAATRALEEYDRQLKADRGVYELYALLERPAVWKFEKAVKRLQWGERGASWVGEAVDAYEEIYAALHARSAWMIERVERVRADHSAV